jgi:hypothetical protein
MRLITKDDGVITLVDHLWTMGCPVTSHELLTLRKRDVTRNQQGDLSVGTATTGGELVVVLRDDNFVAQETGCRRPSVSDLASHHDMVLTN